jgi:hypothetical protein
MSATHQSPATTRLMNLIIAVITPMFLWSSDGDIPLARLAAIETINEFRIIHRLSLFTVAKIVAFDLCTLSSLSQSMIEDVSILLALKLRNNANGLDRSSDRNRRHLEDAQPVAEKIPDIGELTEDSLAASLANAQRAVAEATARLQADQPQPAPQPSPAPAHTPPPAATPTPANLPQTTAATPITRTQNAEHQNAWANAMTNVAAEFQAGLKDLPPAERAREMLRINALTEVASNLASGATPPPVPANAPAMNGRYLGTQPHPPRQA